MESNNINNIYDRNLEVIQRRLPPCYQGILEYSKENPESGRVVIDKSVNDEKIVAVQNNGRTWYLNSRYDAAAASKSWIEGIGNIDFNGVMIVCGMSNFMNIRELIKRCDQDNVLMIYEPDPEIFVKLLEEIDITDILSDNRIFIFAESINMNYFKNYFSILFQYEKINNSKIVILPNYSRIYKEQIEGFVEMVQKRIMALEVDKNTHIAYGEGMNDNNIDNIWFSIFSSSINELKNTIEKVNIEGVPCIIVAAGPSLDKNIDQLRNAKGKALIIAVDSAIKAMMSRNIIPDILVTIDSHKPMTLFEDERISGIPLVVCMHSRVEVLQKHKGKLFMFATINYIDNMYKYFEKELSILGTAGSVANNAFSLAKYLGFRRIIMIGQDLAFTDNRKHVSNAYKETAVGEDKAEKYIEIEDQEGKPILTFPNFKLYRDWFESEIVENPDLHVINATEGGAKIHGAEAIPLKTAIEKYCLKDIEFDKIIASAPDSFDDKEKIEYYNMLKEIPLKMEDMKKKFRKCIRDYDKFYELIRKGKNNTSEFKHVLASIEEVNNLDRIEPLMEFILLYAKEDEYDMKQSIYTIDKTVSMRDEGKEIADKGIKMLTIYIKACDKVIDRVKYVFETIVDEKKIKELT